MIGLGLDAAVADELIERRGAFDFAHGTRRGSCPVRALRIVAELGGCDEGAARRLHDACGWRARTAIVMARLGLDAAEADALIERHHGRLDRVLDS